MEALKEICLFRKLWLISELRPKFQLKKNKKKGKIYRRKRKKGKKEVVFNKRCRYNACRIILFFPSFVIKSAELNHGNIYLRISFFCWYSNILDLGDFVISLFKPSGSKDIYKRNVKLSQQDRRSAQLSPCFLGGNMCS